MVDLTGAGLGESIAATVGAVDDFDDVTDIGDVALNLGAAAIDGIGFLANPVDALATSAISWLVEHRHKRRTTFTVALPRRQH